MNDLSKPKKLPAAEFSKVEDKRNCRFKPKISRKSRAMIKHNDDPDAFIYRVCAPTTGVVQWHGASTGVAAPVAAASTSTWT